MYYIFMVLNSAIIVKGVRRLACAVCCCVVVNKGQIHKC